MAPTKEKSEKDQQKEHLRETKHPGQLTTEEANLFSKKELADWRKEQEKAVEAEQESRKRLAQNQTRIARLERLRKLMRKDPAIAELVNENQALKARLRELEKGDKGTDSD